jgi:hypothetical protein
VRFLVDAIYTPSYHESYEVLDCWTGANVGQQIRQD